MDKESSVQCVKVTRLEHLLTMLPHIDIEAIGSRTELEGKDVEVGSAMSKNENVEHLMAVLLQIDMDVIVRGQLQCTRGLRYSR